MKTLKIVILAAAVFALFAATQCVVGADKTNSISTNKPAAITREQFLDRQIAVLESELTHLKELQTSLVNQDMLRGGKMPNRANHPYYTQYRAKKNLLDKLKADRIALDLAKGKASPLKATGPMFNGPPHQVRTTPKR